MAHPMYGINELLKKFPLVEKAFERTESEIEAAFFFRGGEAAVIKAPKQLIETIDQNIDGTDIEKQALIIAAMYSLAPEALAGEIGNFASEYDASTKDVMDALLAHEENAVAPESLSRVTTVLSICVIDATADMIAGGATATAPNAAQGIKQGIQDAEKNFLTNLNAPRLEALYQASKQNLFSQMDKSPQAKTKKPDGPKA